MLCLTTVCFCTGDVRARDHFGDGLDHAGGRGGDGGETQGQRQSEEL